MESKQDIKRDTRCPEKTTPLFLFDLSHNYNDNLEDVIYIVDFNFLLR